MIEWRNMMMQLNRSSRALVSVVLLLVASAASGNNVADATDDVSKAKGQTCTAYVIAALASAGFDTASKVAGANYTVADAVHMNPKVIKETENLEKLVLGDRPDPRTRGVVNALVGSNQGTEIPNPTVATLQRGDIVQYWYKKDKVLLGHTAVVVGKSADGKKVILRGSHSGEVGDLTSGFTQTLKLYAVRPK